MRWRRWRAARRWRRGVRTGEAAGDGDGAVRGGGGAIELAPALLRSRRQLRSLGTSPIPTDHAPDLYGVYALNRDGSPAFTFKVVFDEIIGIAGDLHGSDLAVGFHPTCHIHRCAPQIVNEFLTAYHARYDGAGVDADTESVCGRRKSGSPQHPGHRAQTERSRWHDRFARAARRRLPCSSHRSS